LHRIARRGRFGINGTRVLPQFEVKSHEEVMAKVNSIPERFKRNGMDFGFVVSYNALIRFAIDDKNKWLFIYYEYYKNNMTDDKTAKELEKIVDKKKDIIIADSAEPKTIKYYQQEGFKMIGAW
jgi:phage terminase large subunit